MEATLKKKTSNLKRSLLNNYLRNKEITFEFYEYPIIAEWINNINNGLKNRALKQSQIILESPKEKKLKYILEIDVQDKT